MSTVNCAGDNKKRLRKENEKKYHTDAKDFMRVINLAFSYIEFGTKLLVYYLDKIKKYTPIIIDGKLVTPRGYRDV